MLISFLDNLWVMMSSRRGDLRSKEEEWLFVPTLRVQVLGQKSENEIERKR